MAFTRFSVLTVVVMASLLTGSMAQSSSNCMNVLISMSPCLNYITGNSSTPSSGCCSQLANVVSTQPKCLCEVISGEAASSLGLNINRTVALELPSACNIQTPPVSRCNASSTSESPSSSTTPGSKSVPPSNGSNGQAAKEGVALFLFVAQAGVLLWAAI